MIAVQRGSDVITVGHACEFSLGGGSRRGLSWGRRAMIFGICTIEMCEFARF